MLFALCVFRKRLIAQAGLLVKQRPSFVLFVVRTTNFSALSAFSAVQDFVRERLRGSAANSAFMKYTASAEFLCGRHFQLIQEFMEGSGGEVDHHGFGPKGYFVSIFQLIGLV